MAARHVVYRPFVLGVLAGVAGVVLVAAGIAHASIQARIDAILATTVAPARPLATLPLTLGEFEGLDVPLDVDLDAVASFDDFFINRAYRHPDLRQPVSVFVGYVGRPRTHIGHRPDVCYAAHGWDQTGTAVRSLTTTAGGALSAKLYEFTAPEERRARMQVLATYLVNGQFTVDPAVYGGWNSRRVDPFGPRRPAYLARVQIALPGDGQPEELVLLEDLAARVSAHILSIMPGLAPTESSE